MKLIESEYHPNPHISETKRITWAVELPSEEGRLFIIEPEKFRTILRERPEPTLDTICEKLGFQLDGLSELMIIAVPKAAKGSGTDT